MEQDRFVRLNSPLWEELEKLTSAIHTGGIKSLSADELMRLSGLYRRTSGSLAYATSQGYDRKLLLYLNDCVAKAYAEIYRDEPFTMADVKRFLLYDFPREFRAQSVPIALAAFIFVFSAILFGYLVYTRPECAVCLVPEGMVQGVESGVSPEGEQSRGALTSYQKSVMSHQIMVNNIKVGIRAFALGIFFGVGTVHSLIYNAQLIGTLAALSAHNHQSILFWSLILPHGVIELTAIFICAGAGFLLALALIDPGQYSRLDALKVRSREAAFLMLGSIALFAVAALIEGFITPLPIPPWSKLVFSGIVAVFMYVYLTIQEPSTQA
ncbi:MAG: stage II sporulation protein M [Candidatus Xenobiia bacterium LiM19]